MFLPAPDLPLKGVIGDRLYHRMGKMFLQTRDNF
jgi:hypothetical protein